MKYCPRCGKEVPESYFEKEEHCPHCDKNLDNQTDDEVAEWLEDKKKAECEARYARLHNYAQYKSKRRQPRDRVKLVWLGVSAVLCILALCLGGNNIPEALRKIPGDAFYSAISDFGVLMLLLSFLLAKPIASAWTKSVAKNMASLPYTDADLLDMEQNRSYLQATYLLKRAVLCGLIEYVRSQDQEGSPRNCVKLTEKGRCFAPEDSENMRALLDCVDRLYSAPIGGADVDAVVILYEPVAPLSPLVQQVLQEKQKIYCVLLSIDNLFTLSFLLPALTKCAMGLRNSKAVGGLFSVMLVFFLIRWLVFDKMRVAYKDDLVSKIKSQMKMTAAPNPLHTPALSLGQADSHDLRYFAIKGKFPPSADADSEDFQELSYSLAAALAAAPIVLTIGLTQSNSNPSTDSGCSSCSSCSSCSGCGSCGGCGGCGD